jgi:hypothetical protein
MRAWKATLLATGILLFAGPAFAQCESASAPNCGPYAFYDPSNNFYNPENNFYGADAGSRSFPALAQPEDNESVTVAVNDGQYVPSVIVDFDQAVAMGKAQLASLGEAAKEAEAVTLTSGNASILAQQDAAGNLLLCNRQGDACRPL